MFYFSFFILDSSLFSLASPPSPLPSDFDLRRSFRPLARCRAFTSYISAAINLVTVLSSHTTPRGLSPAGHSFSTLALFSPTLTHTLYSVHCIATDSDSAYKYPSPALLKSRQLRPKFSHFRLRALRATAALLSSSLLVFPRLSLAGRFDLIYQYSSPPSVNPCVPPPRHPLTSCLDHCTDTCCGSGDNNPRTPPLVTPVHVLSSGASPGFYSF